MTTKHTPSANRVCYSGAIPKLTAKRKGRIVAEGWLGDFAEVFGEDDTLTAIVTDRLNAHDELVEALQDIIASAERAGVAIVDLSRGRAALAKVKP